MSLKVNYEYEESLDGKDRFRKIAKILAQSVYSYLKEKGLLRVDPKRKEKVQKAIDKAREITGRGIDYY